MNISDRCVDLVKSFEGCKLEAYKDAVGIPTIGYGHIEGVQMGDTITQEQADEMLKSDLEDKAKEVSKLLQEEVSQSQFDALVSFAYNVGVGNLKTSTLLRKVNAGEDAGEEFLRWNKAGGVVFAGLTRRREAERELYEMA